MHLNADQRAFRDAVLIHASISGAPWQDLLPKIANQVGASARDRHLVAQTLAGGPVRRSRVHRLARRGDLALIAAAVPAAFLAAALAGSAGQWRVLHTWLAVAVAALAALSLACRSLAAHLDRPKGESPPVSHPHPVPSLTPSEVRK